MPIDSMYKHIMFNGFSIRQAIRSSDVLNREPKALKREPWVLGTPLLIALEKNNKNSFIDLMGKNFVNVWGPRHINLVLRAV